MRVFISWSGDTSHKVADILYEWLCMIKIPSLEPYISDEIKKGAFWFPKLVEDLKKSDCGILCLTKESLTVPCPWLLLEAGALLTAKENSFVAPFLFRISRSDVSESDIVKPLANLQSTVFTKKDIKGLIYALNGFCGKDRLSKEEFEVRFQNLYPALEQELLKVPAYQQARQQELPEEVRRVLMKYFPAPDGTMEGGRHEDGETFRGSGN